MARRGSRNVNTGRACRCLDLVGRFYSWDAIEEAGQLAKRLRSTHWVRVVKLRDMSIGVYALAGKNDKA